MRVFAFSRKSSRKGAESGLVRVADAKEEVQEAKQQDEERDQVESTRPATDWTLPRRERSTLRTMQLGVISTAEDVEIEVSQFSKPRSSNGQEPSAASRDANCEKSTSEKNSVGANSSKSGLYSSSRVSPQSIRRYLGFPVLSRSTTGPHQAPPRNVVTIIPMKTTKPSPALNSNPASGSETESTSGDSREDQAKCHSTDSLKKDEEDKRSVASTYIEKLEKRSPAFFFDEVDYVERLDSGNFEGHRRSQSNKGDKEKDTHGEKNEDNAEDWDGRSTDEESAGDDVDDGSASSIDYAHERVLKLTEAFLPKIPHMPLCEPKEGDVHSDAEQNQSYSRRKLSYRGYAPQKDPLLSDGDVQLSDPEEDELSVYLRDIEESFDDESSFSDDDFRFTWKGDGYSSNSMSLMDGSQDDDAFSSSELDGYQGKYGEEHRHDDQRKTRDLKHNESDEDRKWLDEIDKLDKGRKNSSYDEEDLKWLDELEKVEPDTHRMKRGNKKDLSNRRPHSGYRPEKRNTRTSSKTANKSRKQKTLSRVSPCNSLTGDDNICKHNTPSKRSSKRKSSRPTGLPHRSRSDKNKSKSTRKSSKHALRDTPAWKGHEGSGKKSTPKAASSTRVPSSATARPSRSHRRSMSRDNDGSVIHSIIL